MNEENPQKVSVMRRFGENRWVKIVEGGAVVGTRPGWVQIWDPITIEGVLINARPENAEWFALESKNLQVIFHE